MQESRTRWLVLTGLSIALLAVGAFITVPFGPVPFTLQTMMVGIVICLLPPVYSVAAVGGYLAIGMLGLPVFSGMRGGIGVLAGPTGGFLLGFLVAAIVIAVIRSLALGTGGGFFGNKKASVSPHSSGVSGSKSSLKGKDASETSGIKSSLRGVPKEVKQRSRLFLIGLDVASLLLLALIYYSFGCLWFMVSTGATLEAALAACVLPFIIPDIIKAAAAILCVQPVRAALGLPHAKSYTPG